MKNLIFCQGLIRNKNLDDGAGGGGKPAKVGKRKPGRPKGSTYTVPHVRVTGWIPKTWAAAIEADRAAFESATGVPYSQSKWVASAIGMKLTEQDFCPIDYEEVHREVCA